MDTCPLLLNMSAGAAHAQSGPAQLERMAKDAGLTLEIILTHKPEEMTGHLKRLIAAGAPKVAVAGGDGTVSLAVQELAHTQTALGILSMGTFNNFASTLRLHHNLPAALRTLKDGLVQSVDLGRVGGKYFTESAGAGLFADALSLYGAGSNKNLLHGLYATLRLALAFRARPMQVTVDGEVLSERVTLCEITNTYRIAQAVPIAPEADVADGLLDVVLISDLKRDEVLPYLHALRAQLHLGLPKVKALRGHTVIIESSQPRNIHCSDQIVGVTPQTITVEPGALKVLVDELL